MLSITLLFILQSCAKETETENIQYFNVDPALWELYASFENEASKRGMEIDLNELGISAEISNIHENGVAGLCQYGSAINNHITIDLPYWNRSGASYREFVVFHELGHCALERGHDESQNNAGLCLSIMRSGVESCRDAYNVSNRSIYLDELFLERD